MTHNSTVLLLMVDDLYLLLISLLSCSSPLKINQERPEGVDLASPRPNHLILQHQHPIRHHCPQHLPAEVIQYYRQHPKMTKLLLKTKSAETQFLNTYTPQQPTAINLCLTPNSSLHQMLCLKKAMFHPMLKPVKAKGELAKGLRATRVVGHMASPHTTSRKAQWISN